MKITSVEAVPFTIPYHHPMVFAAGELSAAEHVLIRVHTDEGLTGIGEAAARPMVYGESQSSIANAVRDWIEPALLGLDPFAVEEASARLAWLAGNNTARGAVDIALHDLRGRATNLPSWRLLGGAGTPMRVTRCLTMGEPAVVRDEALSAVSDHGVSAFKVKVGLDVRSDIERVAAVRDAVGDDAFIFVDANHGWTAEEAMRALEAMEELRLDLVEEPSPAADRIGRLRLAERIAVPIMADESAPTLADAARELVSGAARALSIKTMRTGFTESGRLVALATALGARALLGGQADSMIGTAASIAFGSSHPHVGRAPGELDHFLLIKDHILTEPLTIVDGMLAPSDSPGIGVQVDEEKLATYRVDR